jgi:glycosyltransferase involved in cell wall biosynthesis
VFALDLDEPVHDLDVGDASHAHVTAFARGQPLGSVVLPAPINPLPGYVVADLLAERFGMALYRERLRARLAPPAPQPPPLSTTVLVCTRDRPDDLRQSLRAIAQLVRPADEVLVVDSGASGGATREVVEAAGFEYVAEPVPGLDRARNSGLARASGDVVLCTDDDVEVDPGWSDALLRCFDDPLVGAATGLVLPKTLDTEARRRFELYAGFGRGVHRRVFDGSLVSPYRAGSAGAGASMAFRTFFLRATGGFPEELDAGTPTGSGGDTFALADVLRFGLRVVYEPRALAFHTHRDTEEGLRAAVRGYGTGISSYLAAAALRRRDPGAVLVGARFGAGYVGGRLVGAALRCPDAPPLGLAAVESLGALRGLTAYAASRRRVRHQAPALRATGTPASWLDAYLAGSAKSEREQDGALPSMSVVIPSRGRRASLLRLLRALDAQVYPDDLLEVIVALDGDVDGSEAAVKDAGLRRTSEVVVLDALSSERDHGSGAGTVRNAGAARATGDIIVFLDDDVMPAHDGVLLAHGRAHGVHPGAAVGPCPPVVHDPRTLFAMRVRAWGIDNTRRLLTADSLHFTDLCTGNVSIARALFCDLEGFRPLPRREDWELGYRLVGKGAPLFAAPDASVVHDADLALDHAIEDRRREGAGDYMLARMHPEALAWLPLSGWDYMNPATRRLVHSVLRRWERMGAVTRRAQRGLSVLERAGLREEFGRLLEILYRLSYWTGVALAGGGEQGWFDLLATARAVRTPAPRLDLTAESCFQPPRGALGEVELTADGIALGRAPLRWGGVPWDAGAFAEAIVDRFADLALFADARSRASP